MIVQQLSLWDNEALETGYRCLAALELEEAIRQFNNALQSGIGEQELIQKSIAACNYWQPRLQLSSGAEVHDGATASLSQHIAEMLADYIRYPFNRQMDRFKKNLLGHIVDLLYNEADMDLKDMETAFDLLLGIGDFQKAEDLISQCIKQHPENHSLLYFLAQAQWRNGNRSEANSNFAWLLLYHPDITLVSRIENSRLKELIHSYGPAMTPAYGWLRNVLPFVPLADEILACNEEHQKAIESYRLLQEANKALQNNDRNSSIKFRRQLKELVPEFFEEYLNWINQQ